MRCLALLIVATAASLFGPEAVLRVGDQNDGRLPQTMQMIQGTDDVRPVLKAWRNGWMVDQPSHLTPDRVHGGIGP